MPQLVLKTKELLRNPHLYIIGVLIIALFIIYDDPWPWVVRLGPDTAWYHRVWISWVENFGYMEFKYHIIGSLIYVPTFYAAIIFRWRGALIAWLLSLAGILPLITEIWRHNLGSLVPNMVFLLLPIMLILIIVFELQWRAREKAILVTREEDRQRYIAKVLETQENERQRISQELHDDTIQTLLLILSRAEAVLSDSNAPADVRENALQIKETTIRAVEDLRRMTLDLRPSILDNLGLIPALRWLIDRVNKESHIHCKIIIIGQERKLSPRRESTIFRIVQEALNNIKRHSRAGEASVKLDFTEDQLRIVITDDGQGFSIPRDLGWFANKGSVGLIGIQERINYLGGTFQIHSSPGKGTRLLFEAAY